MPGCTLEALDLVKEVRPLKQELCINLVVWGGIQKAGNVYIAMAGEGNGTPLQYSCLENPMDGGAWWAAVHGVAKSRT